MKTSLRVVAARTSARCTATQQDKHTNDGGNSRCRTCKPAPQCGGPHPVDEVSQELNYQTTNVVYKDGGQAVVEQRRTDAKPLAFVNL